MNFIGIILLVFLKIIEIENRMLRYEGQGRFPSMLESRPYRIDPPIMETVEKEKVIGIDQHDEEYETDDEIVNERGSRPCAIVVLSSGQDPAMQTLLRRYRYDSKGVLIPGSVKYFVKVPKGFRDTSEVLVPVNDRAFSPRGGFIRYYKEVPPIPHSFRNRH